MCCTPQSVPYSMLGGVDSLAGEASDTADKKDNWKHKGSVWLLHSTMFFLVTDALWHEVQH